MLKGDNERRESQVAAWNAAADHEVYFEPVKWDEDVFLKQIDAHVPLNKKMRVLDIGCGGGRYAMAFAERVGEVVGIDVAPRMVEKAREMAKEREINNIKYMVGDFPIMKKEELPENFDLVFAHMTPAIADMEDLEKMRALAGKKGAYFFIVKPGRRKGHLDETIMEMMGLPIVPRDVDKMIPQIFSELWGEGFNPSISNRPEKWESERTVEHSMSWIFNRMKAYCGIPEEMKDKVKACMEELAVDGLLKEKVNVIITTIWWRESEKQG